MAALLYGCLLEVVAVSKVIPSFVPVCSNAAATSLSTADIACICSYLFCEHSCRFGSLDPRCCPSTFLNKCRRVILQSECESCVWSFSLKKFFIAIIFQTVQNSWKFLCYTVSTILSKQKFPPPSLSPFHIYSHTHTYSSAKAFSCQRSIQKDSFKLCAGGHNSLAEEGKSVGDVTIIYSGRLYKYDLWLILLGTSYLYALARWHW